MRCPYLHGSNERLICGTSLSSMTPDPETLQSFCNDRQYDRCPILLAHMLRLGQRRWVEKYGQVSAG